MEELSRAYQEGGFMMPIIMFSGMTGLLLCIIQFGLLKKVNLLPIIFGCSAGIFLAGLFGSVMILIQGFSAIADASPDQIVRLMISIVKMAINPSVIAILFTGITLLIGSIAATIRVNLKVSN